MEQSKLEPDSETSYLLRDEYLEPDSEDDFAYEEVSVEDGDLTSSDEDLPTALRNKSHSLPPSVDKSVELSVVPHPEVVEDFVCNFLASNKMHATLEAFQAEWYRLARTNELQSHQAQPLPDAYAQIHQLESSLEQLNIELQALKKSSMQSKEMLLRCQKERDYHRMHHRRVLQEKERLITDLKRLKSHYSGYQPIVETLKQKYQIVSKEKMLACLERDRVKTEVSCLQSTLQSVQQVTGSSTNPASRPSATPKAKPVFKRCLDLPTEPVNNCYQDIAQLPVCTHLTRTGGFQPSHSIQAHSFAATALDLHPTKPVVATASDDHSWRLWTISSGELMMSGEGHGDWLSAVQFNPEGTFLATSSGDGSVKVWDLKQANCIETMCDHQQPVWSVSWHWGGTVLASGGMDHTIKLWSPFTGVCLSTLRGHADSVNCVSFLPFSNTLTSCSADKSVSLWDIRTGLCVHSFYGHQHACYCVKPTFQGWEVFSGDCFGNLYSWDVRGRCCSGNWNIGLQALNCLAVDPARTLVACASDSHAITLLDPAINKEWKLQGHEERVLAVAFTSNADGLVSTASDGTLTVWQ